MSLYSIIYRLFKFIEKALNYSASKYYSSEFKKCGENFKTFHNLQLHNGKFIEVGTNVRFGKNCRIECISEYHGKKYHPKLIIGNNVVLNDNVHIGCTNSVIIEDFVLMGSNIYISDHNHGIYDDTFNIDIPFVEQPLTKNKSVRIGRNCWIGDGCFILPGVNIGNNCVIAANSVVNKDIPDNSMCAGIPARVIKKYDVLQKRWVSVNI